MEKIDSIKNIDEYNNDEKQVIAGANCIDQKFYIDPKFSKLPSKIQEDIQVICVTLSEKLGCIFLMGFYDDGEVYFETVQFEDDINFDHIGSELEIKRIVKTHRELIESLTLWYQLVIQS